MAETTATYDDGDGASAVRAYTDEGGGVVPAGVAAFVAANVAVPVDAAHPLPVTLPVGVATEETATEIAVGIGAPDDAAAGTDTGTFSIVALLKRGLQALTTLVSRVPALVGGRVPVDGSGVTQPVSGPLTNAQLRAADVPVTATLVGQTGTVAVGVSGNVAVTGPVTDAQLRASPVTTIEVPGGPVVVNIASGATGSGLIASSGSMPAGANTWLICVNTPSTSAQLISFTTQYTDGTNFENVPVVWETFSRQGPGALISSSDFHQGVFQTMFRAYSEGRPVRVNLGSAPVAIVVTFIPIYVSQPAVTPVRLAAGVTSNVQINVGTSGLRQKFRRVSDATINAVVVANASRVLFSMWASNTSASVKYVKLYTKTTAPVPASDVPDYTFPLPPGFAGFLFNSPVGDAFTGLAITITGGIADTDTTAVGAGDVVVNANYGA